MWIEQQADALGRVCTNHPAIHWVVGVVVVCLLVKLVIWAFK